MRYQRKQRKQGRVQRGRVHRKNGAALLAGFCGLALLNGSAQAQYGGGGGYGGGPPRPLGWVAQLRPGVPDNGPYTPHSPGDYDWTGLDLLLELIAWPGAPVAPPSSSAKYYNYFGASQNFGLASNWSDVRFTLNGTATFKWLWQPPLRPKDQTPDFDDFPAPALYTLGYVGMSVTGQGSDLSITVQGSVDPGGQNWMDSDQTPNSFGPAPGPVNLSAAMAAHAVVAASSGNLAVAQMSPTLSGHGVAVPNTNTGRSTGNGSISLSVQQWGLFPIVLATGSFSDLPLLKPFGLPQMGDDTNKFIYNGNLTGQLEIPLAAQVVHALPGDVQWLVDNNKVGWAMHPAIEGLIPYTKEAQGDLILPVTNGNEGVAMYEGLPDSDTGFGLKEVLLKVQGLDSQKAYIQTFFSSTAKNQVKSKTLV